MLIIEAQENLNTILKKHNTLHTPESILSYGEGLLHSGVLCYFITLIIPDAEQETLSSVLCTALFLTAVYLIMCRREGSRYYTGNCLEHANQYEEAKRSARSGHARIARLPSPMKMVSIWLIVAAAVLPMFMKGRWIQIGCGLVGIVLLVYMSPASASGVIRQVHSAYDDLRTAEFGEKEPGRSPSLPPPERTGNKQQSCTEVSESNIEMGKSMLLTLLDQSFNIDQTEDILDKLPEIKEKMNKDPIEGVNELGSIVHDHTGQTYRWRTSDGCETTDGEKEFLDTVKSQLKSGNLEKFFLVKLNKLRKEQGLPVRQDTEAEVIYGPARQDEVFFEIYKDKLDTEKETFMKSVTGHTKIMNDLKDAFKDMQKIVNATPGDATTVPDSFVSHVEAIERIVAPSLRGFTKGKKNLYSAIAKAAMQHYGDCGVCATTSGFRALALYVPYYGAAPSIIPVKRKVGWVIGECELRGTMDEYSSLAEYVDIRTQRDITKYIENKYLPLCSKHTTIVLVPLTLTGRCSAADKLWGGHANQIVINTQTKEICLNDPNIGRDSNKDDVSSYTYISDYVGKWLGDFMKTHGYTYHGYCLKDVLKGRHGGTCRYADQMAIFDDRVRHNTRYYMQRLVWVLKTMTNINTRGQDNYGSKPYEIVPFEEWELQQMTCPSDTKYATHTITAPAKPYEIQF